MFTTREVEQLISDPRIPPEHRVQYALKAIARLWHGDVAGLRWRHYDPTLEHRFAAAGRRGEAS